MFNFFNVHSSSFNLTLINLVLLDNNDKLTNKLFKLARDFSNMIEFTMLSWDVAWAVVLGYLLGSIPFSWIIVKLGLKGLDIRSVGSKNVGGRNVIRAFKHEGKSNGLAYTMGLIAAVLDIFKGYAAMWLAQFISFRFSQEDPWVILAGAFAVLGHNWCIWLWGPGGKGVASTLGTVMYFNPIFFPVWLVLFFLLGSVIMYSAIAYIVSFVILAVVLFFWSYIPWFVTPAVFNENDPSAYGFNAELFGFIAMITMVLIVIVILTRQRENFEKIKTGEASKMKLYKIFYGKADEALK